LSSEDGFSEGFFFFKAGLGLLLIFAFIVVITFLPAHLKKFTKVIQLQGKTKPLERCFNKAMNSFQLLFDYQLRYTFLNSSLKLIFSFLPYHAIKVRLQPEFNLKILWQRSPSSACLNHG
jgi:hypothetical protein